MKIARKNFPVERIAPSFQTFNGVVPRFLFFVLIFLKNSIVQEFLVQRSRQIDKRTKQTWIVFLSHISCQYLSTHRKPYTLDWSVRLSTVNMVHSYSNITCLGAVILIRGFRNSVGGEIAPIVHYYLSLRIVSVVNVVFLDCIDQGCHLRVVTGASSTVKNQYEGWVGVQIRVEWIPLKAEISVVLTANVFFLLFGHL